MFLGEKFQRHFFFFVAIMEVASATWGMDALATSVKEQCTPYSHAVERPMTRKPTVLNSKQELDQDFIETYTRPNRMMGRAYRVNGDGQLTLPYGKDATLTVSPRFVNALSTHISDALERGWVDDVSYADMGHVHLMLPTSEWQALESIENPVARMEAVLASPRLQGLYHTVEMVQLKDGDFARGKLSSDPWKKDRYRTRNLLGDFSGEAPLEVLLSALNDVYNTVRSLPEMTQVSTLYFSGNQGGCFEYQSPRDGAMRFDVSFEALPYEQTAPQFVGY